ncbi:hypothetical protein IFM89_001562 [Coptis chinensis]|uniref:ABC transmembrane type-1 domain-containing protein n=1 Tax=Coptis chinensis TaxID=261450 RepID=A0A835LQB1_9MAGN|nr:hypothetical protein IFM89_001562 [Coptis chinensis]
MAAKSKKGKTKAASSKSLTCKAANSKSLTSKATTTASHSPPRNTRDNFIKLPGQKRGIWAPNYVCGVPYATPRSSTAGSSSAPPPSWASSSGAVQYGTHESNCPLNSTDVATARATPIIITSKAPPALVPHTSDCIAHAHCICILHFALTRNVYMPTQMDLVSQEPALFATTIAGNILYGEVDASMEQIIEAAKASNAHSFIQSLPDGYKTQGEYATLVSLQVTSTNNDPSQNISDSRSSLLSETFNSQIHDTQKINSIGTKEIQMSNQHKDSCSSKPAPSIWKLIKLNSPEWPFTLIGSVGAVLAGMEAPLFALGITYVLDAFYSYNDSRIKHEIRVVSLVFIGVAVATVSIYMLQHYFYTLMGERLTTCVRLSMFSAAILRNEIGWFDLDENNTGSLVSNLAAGATLLRSTLADHVSTIVQNLVLTVTTFIIAFTLSWRMTTVVIATFPLLIGASITEVGLKYFIVY